MEQIDQANSLLDEYGIKVGNKISYVNEIAYVAYTRLLLVQGKFPEAETVLGELHVIIDAGKRVERLIELKICYAILFNMKGLHEKAVTNLVEAMELAAPENLVGFFIFSFDYLHDLLKEVFNIQVIRSNKALTEFIEKLKKAVEKREKQTKGNILIEISTRELDILKLIAEDLSNQEIADKLFLSINTVKSHVKNILLKLDSENRSKAVVKAKKIGII